jgi:hypothetical protein
MEHAMTNPMQRAVRAAHQTLRGRLDLASAAMVDRADTHEIRQKTDAFLANSSRHTSAMCHLVLPAVRLYLPNGRARTREYVQLCRRVERAVGTAKQRMYGQAHAIDRPWNDVWASVVEEVPLLHSLERDLVADLADVPDVRRHPDLSLLIGSVTSNSPTRPHPNSPHTGAFAHHIRALWARADRFWDAAEGRTLSDWVVVVERETLAA